MSTEDSYYVWNSIHFKPRDPETNRFFGNVIGNFSLEDQLKIVDEESANQKADILRIGSENAFNVNNLSQKYSALWSVVDYVEKAITGADPLERSTSNFVESFLETYVPPVDDISNNGTDVSNNDSTSVPDDTEFYIWNPNYLLANDPRIFKYIGNVVGNVPLQEQLSVVTDKGNEIKGTILDISTSETSEIYESSEKFRETTRLNSRTMKEIIKFFGGVFILDSSALDSAPLG